MLLRKYLNFGSCFKDDDTDVKTDFFVVWWRPGHGILRILDTKRRVNKVAVIRMSTFWSHFLIQKGDILLTTLRLDFCFNKMLETQWFHARWCLAKKSKVGHTFTPKGGYPTDSQANQKVDMHVSKQVHVY